MVIPEQTPAFGGCADGKLLDSTGCAVGDVRRTPRWVWERLTPRLPQAQAATETVEYDTYRLTVIGLGRERFYGFAHDSLSDREAERRIAHHYGIPAPSDAAEGRISGTIEWAVSFVRQGGVDPGDGEWIVTVVMSDAHGHRHERRSVVGHGHGYVDIQPPAAIVADAIGRCVSGHLRSDLGAAKAYFDAVHRRMREAR